MVQAMTKSEPLNEFIKVCCSKQEKLLIEQHAKNANRSISNFMRDTVLKSINGAQQ